MEIRAIEDVLNISVNQALLGLCSAPMYAAMREHTLLYEHLVQKESIFQEAVKDKFKELLINGMF